MHANAYECMRVNACGCIQMHEDIYERPTDFVDDVLIRPVVLIARVVLDRLLYWKVLGRLLCR